MRGKSVIGVAILIALLFSSIGVGFSGNSVGNSTKNTAAMRDLNSGLVAYWNFDEGSGDVLHDVSGNGNDGTIYGATWVDGIKGKALNFNGEDNYVKIPNSPSLNPRNATFEAFVYINSYPQYGNASGIIFKYKSYQVNLGCTFTKDDKSVWFGIWGDYLSGGELTLHQWYQIIVTFSQTEIYEGTAKLYINGKLIVSEILMDRIDTTTNPLIIGYKSDTAGGHFNGIIDEVRIYNRALSPQEVKELYEQYSNNQGGNGLVYLWLIIAGAVIAAVIAIAVVMLKRKGGKSQPQSSYYGHPPQYPQHPPQQVQQSPPQQTQPPQYQQTGYPPPPPSSQGGFMNKPQPPPPQSMGMITVTCPYCGFTLQMPENMRGQWVQCPKCGNRFQVQ